MWADSDRDKGGAAATDAAELGTSIVRVFSFFVPPAESPERHRQRVIDRMGALTRIAEDRGLVLAHENEKDIYGSAAPTGSGSGQGAERAPRRAVDFLAVSRKQGETTRLNRNRLENVYKS
jgi:sugar phosphate isomerase/epimerase